jgi:hypothetical protein
MRGSVTILAVSLLALAAGGLSRAEDSVPRRYELPNLDTLELVLPAGWRDTVDMPPGEAELTIQLGPVAGDPFEVFLTPVSPDRTAPTVPDVTSLQSAVRDAASRVQPQAIEESLEIRRLQGTDGVGFYFSATEREPHPEDFRYMTQGALLVGELTLWFTILSNDGQEQVVAETLAMLQAALHRGTGADRH